MDHQQILLNGQSCSVELIYQGCVHHHFTHQNSTDETIRLSDAKGGFLIIKTTRSKQSDQKTCHITGIHGGVWLYLENERKNKNKGQTVRLEENNLFLSLGFHFVSINLNTLHTNFVIQPDDAEIMEFYVLENDFLLRGELGIHRISKEGIVKWSYGGADIWVNEYEPEIQILKESIRLVDFQSNRYLIDFEGKKLSSSV